MAHGSRATRVLRWLTLAIFGSLAAPLVAVSVLTHVGRGTVLGRHLEVVRSGSMVPTFRTGDLVVDRPITLVEARDLKVGQIISFRVPTGASTFTVFTHRIVAVTSAGYQTKGDANNVADSEAVPPYLVMGVYERRIPDGGFLLAFAHTHAGLAFVTLLPLLVLAGPELVRAWDDAERSAEDQSGAMKRSTQLALSLIGGAAID